MAGQEQSELPLATQGTPGVVPMQIPEDPAQAIIQLAANPDFDADKLAALIKMRDEQEDRAARKAFISALGAFQRAVPPLEKWKKADKHSYAPLDYILARTKDAERDSGLSHYWETEVRDDGGKTVVTCTCHLCHEAGHERTSTLSSEVDKPNTGRNQLTAGQRLALTKTYLKRNTYKDVCGLEEEGADTGGQLHQVQRVDDEQQAAVEEILVELTQAQQTATRAWLARRGYEKVADIRADDFEAVIAQLEKARKAAR